MRTTPRRMGSENGVRRSHSIFKLAKDFLHFLPLRTGVYGMFLSCSRLEILVTVIGATDIIFGLLMAASYFRAVEVQCLLAVQSNI